MRDAKTSRKRRPKPGDIAALRRLLWACLREAEAVTEADDPELKLKAASTVATLGGIYLRALDQHDLAREVSQLRDEVKSIKEAQSASRYPRAA